MKERQAAISIAIFMTVLVTGVVVSGQGMADEHPSGVVTRSVDADFADVRVDVENAIMNGGYVIDYHSNIGDMLSRTAADVGTEESIYRHAETWQFCSSILSRATMAVDPVNIAYCPYVVFAYETEAEPGQVVVGFRAHVDDDAVERDASLVAVDQALTVVVEEATR